MRCSSYTPSLELCNPFLRIVCCFNEGLDLEITVRSGEFGNQEVEEADMKQTQDYSVLWFLFVCFLARESEGWNAEAILFTRYMFFARM